MWIKSKVENLYTKHGTRDPFELASCLNIIVTFWDLHKDINGFYQYEKRNRFIFINNSIKHEMKSIVCAHELGHAVLHTKTSTPYTKSNTWLSVNKIEREANRFAAELLIPDDSFKESNNIYDIASIHNVPVELVRLKCEKLF